MKAISVLAFVLFAGTAFAQTSHQHHPMPATPSSSNTPTSVRAYQAANDKMHKDMAIAFTGNADIDFVRGMIPHHQGAIDMAKVVLAHGKDPAIRKLAEEVIAAQTKEIEMMNAWLKTKTEIK